MILAGSESGVVLGTTLWKWTQELGYEAQIKIANGATPPDA